MNADELFQDFKRLELGEQMRFLELLRRMREGIMATNVKNQRAAQVEASNLIKKMMEWK